MRTYKRATSETLAQALRGAKNLTFTQLVELRGCCNLARDLGTTKQSVSYWAKNLGLPEPEMIKNIFEKTKGKATYRSIIEGYLKNRKLRK